MDCRKNCYHTTHPPDLTDSCLLSFALWTLETILNGFRRLSGVTLPTCSTRVKADLQRYCASQHSFQTSEVVPSLSSLLHKCKTYQPTNQLKKIRAGETPDESWTLCFTSSDMFNGFFYYYLPTYLKGQKSLVWDWIWSQSLLSSFLFVFLYLHNRIPFSVDWNEPHEKCKHSKTVRDRPRLVRFKRKDMTGTEPQTFLKGFHLDFIEPGLIVLIKKNPLNGRLLWMETDVDSPGWGDIMIQR